MGMGLRRDYFVSIELPPGNPILAQTLRSFYPQRIYLNKEIVDCSVPDVPANCWYQGQAISTRVTAIRWKSVNAPSGFILTLDREK
jgi:hypothetical protein